MERRTFMAMVTGGIVVAPFSAEAQQAAKIARIGFLSLNQGAGAWRATMDIARCLSLGDYVMGLGATRGTAAAKGC